jgi:hypothetical protein
MIFIISFSRSGNHLTRFLLEWFSGRPTLGCRGNGKDVPLYAKPELKSVLSHVNPKLEPIGSKHYYFDLPKNPIVESDTVLLILRNYKECVLRHTLSSRSLDDNDSVDQIIAYLTNYIDIIQWVHEWKGKLIIVYYEDLISNLADTVPKLLNALNMYDEKKWNEFYSKKDDLLASCIDIYDNTDNIGSITKGSDTEYYQKHMVDTDLLNRMDTIVREKIEDYSLVSRYMTDNQV